MMVRASDPRSPRGLAAPTERRPVFEGRVGGADADDGHDAGDVGIAPEDGLDLSLQGQHALERDVLSGFRHDGEEARILLRHEALRNDDVEPDGRDEGRRGGHQGQRPSAQHPVQAHAIEAQHGIQRGPRSIAPG